METAEGIDQDWRRNPRRRFRAEERLEMVRESEQPGVSVAQVAQRHGINANLLFTWRKRYGTDRDAASSSPVLLPVTVVDPLPAVKENVKPKRKRSRHSGVRSSRATPAPGAIEIEMPGARIFLHGAVCETNLGAVLRVLGRK